MTLEKIQQILKDHGLESTIQMNHFNTHLEVRCVQPEATYTFSEKTPLDYIRAFLGY